MNDIKQQERKPFASTSMDWGKPFGVLSPNETAIISELFVVVSNMLRLEANKVGKDLDEMVETTPGLKDIAKWVVLDVVSRYITNQQNVLTGDASGPKHDVAAHKAVTQTTHSAGGYSVTNTYQTSVPGLFIKKSELARLGLRRQQVGVISFGGSL